MRKIFVFSLLLAVLVSKVKSEVQERQQQATGSASDQQERFFDLASLFGHHRYRPYPYGGGGGYPYGSGYPGSYPGGGGYGGYGGSAYGPGYGTNFIGNGAGYGGNYPQSSPPQQSPPSSYPSQPSYPPQSPSYPPQSPSYPPSDPNSPPSYPPSVETFPPSNPPEWGPQTPTYPDPTWNETFFEIGNSLPRAKRDVKFPTEEETTEEPEVITDIDIETLNGSVDGRALPQLIQSVTKIDVGPQSQLFVAPGSTSVIYFEVTNLRNEPTYHNFNVQDEKRFLRQMEPRFLWLMPNQKESVRVTILVPTGSELGAKDKITFTSQGIVQAQQSVVVTIATNGVVDPWQPHVWYTYSTRCDWRQSCVGGTWSVEVVARDYESGMLSIRSNPEGLLVRAPFTAGTNEEVKATYSASCCEPRVTITAYDLNRNQRTIQLNVDEPWLSEYAIATVVLACLFFICLIVLIVLLCRWCIRRRKMSRDLPTYRPGDVRPRPSSRDS